MKMHGLKGYKVIKIARPQDANVRRWIVPDAKIIIVNTAGQDGKIDRLLFNICK